MLEVVDLTFTKHHFGDVEVREVLARCHHESDRCVAVRVQDSEQTSEKDVCVFEFEQQRLELWVVFG